MTQHKLYFSSIINWIVLSAIGFHSLLMADVPMNKSIKSSLNNVQSMMVDSSYNFISRDIDTYISNNGLMIDYHPRGDSSLRYKDVSAIFQGSVWAAGTVDGSIRAIVGDYTQDMGPGSYGSDATSDAFKIYYVHTGMFTDPANYDDFQNWPINQGAPFVDVNGNGIYEPLPAGDDYPHFIGDKVAFFVANDGDPAYKLNFQTSPMNLEMQFLVYSFDQPVSDYLAQSLFFKVLVINKGTDEINNTYFGVFFDDDLGYAGDDLVGVSVDRGLGFTYNDGDDSSMSGAGIQPFVKGSDFLQGPMIQCISGGTVSFNLSASDSDGDTLVYQVNTNPSNGSVNCNSATGSCTYTPNSGYTGSDSFTYYVYEASDSSRQSNTATVTINVQSSRGEIGIDNLQITTASKQGFLPHPNSQELVTAMKEIKFDEHEHNHNGFVRCAADELERELQLINPEFIKKRDEFYDLVHANEERFRTEQRTTVDIPVIFHVLYYDSDDNISASQIGENFNQLNDDFKLENADKDNIPSSANSADATFDPSIDYSHYDVRGTHDINFVGFDGETEGSDLTENTIRRYNIGQQTVSGVSEASTLASSTATDSGVSGGYQEGYLNIYIAPLTGGLLGQAYLGFPEAVVLGSSVGSLDSPGTASGYNRGRTLTHEIGHNFTYNHVFNSASCDDQEWSDIPAQFVNNRDAETYIHSEDTYSDITLLGRYALDPGHSSNGDNESQLNKNLRQADGDLVQLGEAGLDNGFLYRSYMVDYSSDNKLYNFLSDDDRAINAFTMAVSDTNTYETTETLSSDKIYYLKIEGTADVDGITIDAYYNTDDLSTFNLLKMDDTIVVPSNDTYNSTDHIYYYYFYGNDAALQFSFNQQVLSNYTSLDGSFDIAIYELNKTDDFYFGEAINTSDGGYVISGYIDDYDFNLKKNDVFGNSFDTSNGGIYPDFKLRYGIVAKFSADQNLEWSTLTTPDSTWYSNFDYEESGNAKSTIGEGFYSIVENPDSTGYVAVGQRAIISNDTRYNYGYVAEFNSNGEIIGERELTDGFVEGTNDDYSYLFNITPSSDGNYFISGTKALNNSGTAFVSKYDTDFNVVWSTNIDSSDEYRADHIDEVLELSTGEIIMVGSYIQNDGYDDSHWASRRGLLTKVSASGEIIWNNVLLPPDTSIYFNHFSNIVQEENTSNQAMDTFFASTYYSRADLDGFGGVNDGVTYIIRFNTDGEVLDTFSFESPDRDQYYYHFDDMMIDGSRLRLSGWNMVSTNNTYYDTQKTQAENLNVNLTSGVVVVDHIYGKGAENSCIATSGKGDQFMNYMDYVYDDQMRMFSEEQALDGYSWAFSYDWLNESNSLPVANNVTFDATVNEDCTEGAKMFGSRHPGYKNLDMTSYVFFINGDATYTDPSDETEAYNYLQGLRKDGSAFPNELAGDLYDQKFVLYGDPNDSSGHSTSNPLDGNYASSADRRSLMSVGPFTMAAGDSQEIVFNAMMASGTTSLDALTNLFTANDSTQVWYDNDFEILEETNEVKNITISSSVSEGYAPLTATFSLNSTYQFPVYNWDFNEDGTTDSKSLNPTYTFTEAGTYTVSAKALYNYYENGSFLMKEASDTYTITVLDNSAITITADSLVANEDTSLSSALTISNPSNRSYVLQLGLTPSNGVVSFNNATMNYTPNKNFNGLDSLKVFAKDGVYESSEALIKINVLPVDDTPVTADVAVSTNEDTAVTVYLTASEYDGDAYEFEIKEHPANGSLSSILSSAGMDSVIYTPDTDWFGTDQFKFEASDSSSRMNLGTAVIQVLPVNDAPITENVSVDTYEDVTTPITLSFSDVDNDEISITLTTPTNGSVELNGSYAEYIPNSNYYGTDSFNFYVSDGTNQSNISSVSINIEAVNDASSNFEVDNQYFLTSNTGDTYVINTNYLMITPDNIQDSIRFAWNESSDIDGDLVKYRLVGFDQMEFLTMNEWSEALSLSMSVQDISTFTDSSTVSTGYWGVLATDGEYIVESNQGELIEFSIDASALVPDDYKLEQNYPNPFNVLTTIPYDLPSSGYISIKIFDVRGRLIKTLIDEEKNAGFNSIEWDGTNSDGDEVSAGLYFYQLNAKPLDSNKSFIKTKKLIKLR